jgi:hypothetical protein
MSELFPSIWSKLYISHHQLTNSQLPEHLDKVVNNFGFQLNMLKMPCFKNFKKEKRRTFWDDHDIPVRNLDVPFLRIGSYAPAKCIYLLSGEVTQ